MNATELIAKEIAQQNVERFVRKFGEQHRLLAYHAALPLLLTPELLNYLRTEFLYGQVDWVAEVDLLLSPLCVTVGHELYAMDTAARAYLLEEMESEIGRERMQAVARLLLGYVKYLSLNHPFMGVHELEAQQWAAMVVLDDRRETAVSQIVKAFQECAANDGGSGQGLINKAEMARLSHLTQELAPQLREYQSLIDYAQMVGNALDDPNDINPEDLAATYEVLPDVHLAIPDGLASNRKSTKSTFPPLQEFEFEVATLEIEENPLIDFAIITAIEVERKAVCKAFGLKDKDRVKKESRVYWRGRFNLKDGGFYEIVVAQSPDMANVDAALLTSDTIHHWHPESMLMVGIAGAASEEEELGDLILGSHIYYFERGKEKPDVNKLEPYMYPTDSTLWSRVTTLPEWTARIPVKRPSSNKVRPTIYQGVIASGERVIASAAVRDEIAAGQRKIRAIEMEGYGFSKAAWQSFDRVRHLVIRAICDRADSSKNSEWHTYAAAVAAEFTKHFLSDRPLEPRTKNSN